MKKMKLTRQTVTTLFFLCFSLFTTLAQAVPLNIFQNINTDYTNPTPNRRWHGTTLGVSPTGNPGSYITPGTFTLTGAIFDSPALGSKTVRYLKFTVQTARTYAYDINDFGNGNTCHLPAGQTTCVLDIGTSQAFPTDPSGFSDGYVVFKTGSSSDVGLYFVNMSVSPTLVSQAITGKQLTVKINTTSSSRYQIQPAISTGAATATTNTIIQLQSPDCSVNYNTPPTITRAGSVASLAFDLSGITVPMGQPSCTLNWSYDEVLFKGHVSGSITYQVLDKTPPVIHLNGTSPGLLSSFIPVITDDHDPAPVITGATISGGPAGLTPTPLTLSGGQNGAPYALSSATAYIGAGFVIHLTGKDKSGNVANFASQPITITLPDTQPPVISVKVNGQIVQANSAGKITDFTVSVSDNTDPNPTITSVTLADGPAAMGQTPLTLVTGTNGNSTLPAMAVTPGTGYTLTIHAQDIMGNKASYTQLITIDNVPPVISFTGTSPAVLGAFVPAITDNLDPHPVITGATISGGPSSIVSLPLTLHGGTGGTPYSLSSTTNLMGSGFTIHLTGKDNAGNTATYTTQPITLSLPDNTPPVIDVKKNGRSITANTAGKITNFTVSVTDNIDPNPTITSATLSGGPAAMAVTPLTLVKTQTGYMLPAMAVTPGNGYTLTINAQDIMGNKVTYSQTITLDDVPPVITLAGTSPAVLGAYVPTITDNVDTNPTITSATISGGPSSITSAALTLTGGTGGVPYSLSSSSNLMGAGFVIHLTGKDKAGNTTTFTSLPVTISLPDSTPPVIDVKKNGQSITANTAGKITDFTISVKDNIDPNPTITSATLSGGPAAMAVTPLTLVKTQTGYTLPALTVTAGSGYILTVKAQDMSGNKTSYTQSITIDNTPPTTQLLYKGVPLPQSGSQTLVCPTTFQPQSLAIKVSDDTDPVPVIQVTLTDGSNNSYPVSTQWDSVLKQYLLKFTVPDGVLTMHVQARDASGKVTQNLYTIACDTHGPAITLTTNGKPFVNGAAIAAFSALNLNVNDALSSSVHLDPVVITSPSLATPITVNATSGTTNPLVTPLSIGSPLAESVSTSVPYTLTVSATDTLGNKTQKTITFYIDHSAPTIQLNIKNNGNTWVNGDPVAALSQLVYQVSDTFDKNAKVTNVNITGGPTNVNTPVGLLPSTTGTSMQDMSLFPSNGTLYTLTATATDAAGNTTTITSTLNYSPTNVPLFGHANSDIYVPALTRTFIDNAGHPALYTDPVTYSNGSVYTGTSQLTAYSASNSTVPVVIGGKTIAPGQSVVINPAYDFSKTAGSISLPVHTVKDGDEGVANITIKTGVANTSIFSTKITTWSSHVTLAADNWTVQQFLGNINIRVLIDKKTMCRVTTNVDVAKAGDIYADPVCLIKFDTKPATTHVINKPDVKLVGTSSILGKNKISYSVYLYEGSSQILLSTGTNFIQVNALTLNYDLVLPAGNIRQNIQSINTTLRLVSGDTCKLTMSPARAKATVQPGRKKQCLVEWLNLPPGLSQRNYVSAPNLIGRLTTLGANKIAWRISLFKDNGSKTVVSTGQRITNVTAPQPPQLTIKSLSSLSMAGNDYITTTDGGNIAKADYYAPAGDLLVTTSIDGVVSSVRAVGSRTGRATQGWLLVRNTKTALWSSHTYKIKVAYKYMPQLFIEKTITSKTAPSLRLALKLSQSTHTRTVISTDIQHFTVNLTTAYSRINNYDKTTMGAWNVYIGNLQPDGTVHSLTPTVPLAIDTPFDVDLTGITQANLVAVATLNSQVPGYARTIKSRRISLRVLQGRGIHGTIESRKISGSAPLRTVLYIRTSRDAYYQVDKVDWYVSQDAGLTYTKAINPARNTRSFYHVFPLGEYKVKAVIFNKNTGATYETPPVNIIAYHRPEFEIRGALNDYIGTPRPIFVYDKDPGVLANASTALTTEMATLSTTCQSPQFDCTPNTGWYWKLKNDETNANESMINNIYEYSIDNGKIWHPMNGSFTPSATQTASKGYIYIMIRGRSKKAPATDRYAYTTKRTRIHVIAMNKIRAYIYVPRRMEAGKSYVIRGIRRSQQNMLLPEKNSWILPDGTTVDGTLNLHYTPTIADVTKGSALFQFNPGYYGGSAFDAAQGHATSTAMIWKYTFPTFIMSVYKKVDYAPTIITFIVKQGVKRYAVDGLNINWLLPSGVTVKQSGYDRRSLYFDKAGTYSIKANISDARGNAVTLTKTVTLGSMPPFNISIRVLGPTKHYAPYYVSFRPTITGGHIYDRITSIDTYLDGVKRSNSRNIILNQGTHNIKFVIKSRMGVTQSKTITMVILPPQAPICTLHTYNSGAYIMLQPYCQDPKRLRLSYEWYINNVFVSTNNKLLTQKTNKTKVTLRVKNSAGVYIKNDINW